MSHCEECTSRIDLYLDGELREEELDIFNRHVSDCSSCREELAQRRLFLEQIRAAGPLHVASQELRAKVAALMTPEPGIFHAPPPFRRRVESIIMAKGRTRPRFSWFGIGPIPSFVACGLAIIGAVLLWRFSLSEMRATAFVDMAVKAHRQELAGRLPLEIATNSPTEVSTWFAGKVPFHFRLPSYQEGSGQDPKYKLSGGRLVAFRGDSAAYIAYHMKGRLISLIVVSASSSVASGGEKTVSRGLTFHAHRKGELEVVTWSVHNLTYALVSAVNLPAAQSCGVCHSSAKDRDLIRDLKTHKQPRTNGQGVMLLSVADIQRFAAVR
jgi:anti-sigma factor RsiW